MTNLTISIYQEWIIALRSGNYKQCYDVCRTEEDCFCPNGLLIHLLSAKLNKPWIKCSIAGWQRGPLPNSEIDLLCPDKIHWGTKIVEMNDRQKKTFSEIADYIEQAIIPAFPVFELFSQWEQDLRSGQYKQCHYSHKIANDTFCSMGLLFNALCKKLNRVWQEYKGWDSKFEIPLGVDEISRNITINNNLEQACKLSMFITSQNDQGKTFEQIADYVRDELIPGLYAQQTV